jgi:hypothetical protein
VDPVWDPKGSAIYYLKGANLLRRDVRLGEPVELREEQVIFSTSGTFSGFFTRQYDIHPDGDRFIFITSGDIVSAPVAEFDGIGPVEVVVNWFTELRERMGEGN